ncbi:E3 ubiquitin-protein ligase TRIM7-like [Numenius arquata]|uniref:E3 ubiquitin-protein ligase TRIM7-like n=1 Tax=Numenius arquata TaxID=31919 RepID=UPI003D30ABEA
MSRCRETGAQKTLRPNRELANVIEAAKSLNLQRDREMDGGENLCEKHQEPVKLFCQDDKRLICMLEKKFSEFTQKNPSIKELLEKFQDFLEFEFPLTTQMTLDPETANAGLYLSEDCKLVRWEDCEQDLPSNPRRFTFDPCVLGSRGFMSGCHHWDVEVHREGFWGIGVAKESVPRDRVLFLNPDVGVWALCHNQNGYMAMTSPDPTPLTLHIVPKRIRICLDYEEGRVVFFDAESKERIFAFPPASFQGERVFPFFVVIFDAQLKLLP